MEQKNVKDLSKVVILAIITLNLMLRAEEYILLLISVEWNSRTKAYCDTTGREGGWLVIQRRDKEYSTSFDKDWTEYVDGFGNLTTELWFGLSAMNCLTSERDWELHTDFTLSNGTKSYMHYIQFRVGP